MKKFILILAFSASVPLSGAALAQELPGWSTKAGCSAGDDACPFFEADARGKVSGVWSTLPPKIRAECVSETETVGKSYRLLFDCLANKMQVHMRGQSQRS